MIKIIPSEAIATLQKKKRKLPNPGHKFLSWLAGPSLILVSPQKRDGIPFSMLW